MSVAIALPPLDKWVQGHLIALYSAKDEQAFDAEFERVFSQHVSVRVNGKHLSRAEYRKLLLGEIKGDSGAEVQFNSVLAVPAEGGAETIGTGSVGVSFKADISGRLFIFGQRESSTVNSSLNVVVTEDIPRPAQIGMGGAFDGRRVTVVDEILTDEHNKIVPPMKPTDINA